ncbi:DUF930 domain-containing protein [Pararhizobium antarcticum]|uniref:DUF930 domain-containing protein n=1 Tax=Pararhizobium antarcticum TaxID=1798805 RepID=A0A657LNX0_9HYPH|nr:DUF930 domain-containing protein [Pararhizobium antarcticum]OJF91834.1 hypothetical protein AX760_22950 [Pararhizobium antarcticum]OJF92674.1 hypothetical protein AX761_20975 [Rhizobium sp. 58]
MPGVLVEGPGAKAMMQQKTNRFWQGLSWGVIISIALHLVLAAVLLVQLPMPDLTPPEEESISVEIVPPPEEVEEPLPEEKAEEKAEETAKAESPPAEDPQPDEEPADQPAANAPIPVLRPVYEFGETDTGTEKADDGTAARAAPEPEPQTEPEPAPEKVTPVPEEGGKPEETASVDSEPSIETLTALAQAVTDMAVDPLPGVTDKLPETSDVPELEPEPEPQPEPPVEEPVVDIPEAEKLFSEKANDDPVARAAMGNLSRGQRVARLCSSEIYAQLKNGSPSYEPDLVPSYELAKGNLLTVPRAAFRANQRWYDFAFRCEVDDDATRIRSFGVDIGAEVPKSQWRSRKFPSS